MVTLYLPDHSSQFHATHIYILLLKVPSKASPGCSVVCFGPLEEEVDRDLHRPGVRLLGQARLSLMCVKWVHEVGNQLHPLVLDILSVLTCDRNAAMSFFEGL